MYKRNPRIAGAGPRYSLHRQYMYQNRYRQALPPPGRKAPSVAAAHRPSETRPRLSSDWSVWPGPEARPKPAGTDGVTHWRRSIRQPGRDTAHTADKRAPGFLRAACRAPRTSSALLSQPESLQTARESRRYKRQHSHSLASPPIFDPTGTDPPP
ncbi:hypothetical protein M440DRAFT_332287 [Trichoderma longibrachiatum ATCC 18648]|uniref:Uncharacterized protein n=1 Tax=Trichoderma longibrachiatum ATCC 18648 TaxID=983965 RepID=A0A2T4C337_TRILO|nr:hypothetical protein M440DRAFT_332287 [Trichoderma longibrachiatum ATCC 18648]